MKKDEIKRLEVLVKNLSSKSCQYDVWLSKNQDLLTELDNLLGSNSTIIDHSQNNWTNCSLKPYELGNNVRVYGDGISDESISMDKELVLEIFCDDNSTDPRKMVPYTMSAILSQYASSRITIANRYSADLVYPATITTKNIVGAMYSPQGLVPTETTAQGVAGKECQVTGRNGHWILSDDRLIITMNRDSFLATYLTKYYTKDNGYTTPTVTVSLDLDMSAAVS